MCTRVYVVGKDSSVSSGFKKHVPCIVRVNCRAADRDAYYTSNLEAVH